MAALLFVALIGFGFILGVIATVIVVALKEKYA